MIRPAPDLCGVLSNTTVNEVSLSSQLYTQTRKIVYTDDKGWELPENNINEFDIVPTTKHFVVELDNEGVNQANSCFRIIPASGPLNMPITQETGIDLFNDPIAKKYVAELSRLATHHNGKGGKRSNMYWGAILSVFSESARKKMPFQVALMTKAFIMKINKSGFFPRIIGDPIDLNGLRYPVVFNICDILVSIKIFHKSIYKEYFYKIHQELKSYVNENNSDISEITDKFRNLEDNYPSLYA